MTLESSLHGGEDMVQRLIIMWWESQNIIDTTLNPITINSYMVGVRIETTKNNVNNMDCVHIIFFKSYCYHLE